MHVSYRELGRWVDLTMVDDVDELARRLTMAGLEVDGVEHVGRGCDDIVVGRIVTIAEHEEADKLVVCHVDVGDGRERQIVCGATNMKEGDLVPVALPGSQPPALDFEIGEREVMGVESQGMLCSEDELGLAEDAAGLLILPETMELGEPVFAALQLIDTRFDIDLTPNRPDCLSHLGVAREVGAIYGAAFDPSALATDPAWESGAGDVSDVASLDVEDSDGCPRYVAAVLEGVKVGPSPLWLQRMVTAMGMRSINNIVDVTNAVLADIGQPLHAFDLDELADGAVVVRRARADEKILGIDHKEYRLDEEDLVIADASRPVAIAGVMGGADTEVTERTTRVLLECAYFDPTTVRKTSKRLGIHTESSHRFERGIDPAATRDNAAYALSLLLRTQEEVGADVVVRDGILEFHPNPAAPRQIDLDARLVARILGVDLPSEEVTQLLESIGLTMTARDGGWTASVPTFRPDLERPIDLVEEVARLWGYERFEPTLPDTAMGYEHGVRDDAKHEPTLVSRATLRNIEATRLRLLSAGLAEGINYSFVADDDLDELSIPADDRRRTDVVRVANPLSSDQQLMRPTLVPGMLKALRTNVAQRQQDIALFELGRRFFADGEIGTLAILTTGSVRDHFSEDRNWDFYDVKGLVESLVGREAAGGRWARPDPLEPYLHPGVQAQWTIEGRNLGVVGQLHPALVSELELDTPVVVAEIDLDAVLQLEALDGTFRPFPKYPAVIRDFALLYGVDDAYGDLEGAIYRLAERDDLFSTLFESVKLFDVYEGEQVPEGKRSLAVQVVYRSSERTLTDAEIAQADERLLEVLEEETGAVLR